MKEALYAFNRGLVSRLGLARVDLRRLALAASTMTNWMCRVLGYMHLRAGTRYIGSTLTNLPAIHIPFVFATNDTALIEMSTGGMRVLIDDTLLTYPTVSTTVANSAFATGANWTDLDEAGGVSSVGGNSLTLASNGTAFAIREQSVSVASADQAVEHCLHIRVDRGPIRFTVGTSSGAGNLVSETYLACGEHYIAFTPNAATIYIRFYSELIRTTIAKFCAIYTGVMQITTPWTSIESLRSISYDQSADIVYLASTNAGSSVRTLQIERRGVGRSWSLVVYAPEDGPFRVENITPTTLTASALTGNITLTASRATFLSGHAAPDRGVGALFSLTSSGQTVTASITAQNTFTNAIRVTGTGTTRGFLVTVSNTFVATVVLQRSIDSSTGPWTNVTGESYTGLVSKTYTDGLDNQIVFYRIGVETGGFTSGTVDVQLKISTGSVRGIARITTINSAISANAEVLVALGATTATDVWQEGEWSTYRGYPTTVRLHDGRLWWAGLSKIWGSISDGFNLFDETFEGDAGPISRSIGSGPVDDVSWMLSTQRLLLGTQGSEFSIKASSLDEPLTPTNFGIRPATTQGSNAVQAVGADQNGYFVNRSGMRLFELSPSGQLSDYAATDLTAIAPEVGYPGIVRIDIQRQPDTRIHCVLSDGTVSILVLDRVEETLAWTKFETDGDVEDVVVLPAEAGDIDDRVYYVVNRVIGGSTVRYLERWTQELECRGGALNLQADSLVTYTGVATTSIASLGHLEGEQVAVWANGFDVGTNSSGALIYTVSGGQITLATAATNIVVGLPYTARFKSAKKGVAGDNLFKEKLGGHLGLMLADYHPRGLRFGADFDQMDDLPLMENGTGTGDAVQEEMHNEPISFPGVWGVDSRICLEAKAPRPCTVLGAVYSVRVS